MKANDIKNQTIKERKITLEMQQGQQMLWETSEQLHSSSVFWNFSQHSCFQSRSQFIVSFVSTELLCF